MSILYSGDFHASFAGEISSITKTILKKKYRGDKYSGINYQIYADPFVAYLKRGKVYYFDFNDKCGYQYLYRATKILDKVGNEMAVYNEYGMSRR